MQIKDTAFTSDESTQSIANERAKLQLEKIQLERDVHKDKETLQVKTIELGTLQNKVTPLELQNMSVNDDEGYLNGYRLDSK